jgi:hypothetical protein
VILQTTKRKLQHVKKLETLIPFKAKKAKKKVTPSFIPKIKYLQKFLRYSQP